MEMILLAVAVVIITLLVMWVVVSAVVFVWQEMNHNIKNLKRTIKHGLWELEWIFRRR